MSEALEQSDIREGYKEVQFGPKTLVVPTDWSVEQFGDVFHRRRESVDNLEDETVKYVGLKNLDSGQLTINGYDEDGRERSSSRVFYEGDVLFGKLRPNLNKAAIAPFSGVCSSDIIPIYAEKDAQQQYLPYLMHSKFVRDRVVSTMEGTNLPRTSWGDLEKTLIPLPPLHEQRRIADILSTVDEQIQQTEDIIEEVIGLKKGLRLDLIMSGVSHSKYQSFRVGPFEFDIPSSWDMASVEEVAKNLDSQRVPVKKKKREEMVGNIPYYGASGQIDTVDDWLFDDELLLLAEDGENLLSRNKPIAFKISGKTWVNNHAHVLKPHSDMSLEYLLNYFEILSFEPYATGTAQPKLNQKVLNSLEVPKPPKTEQDKISNILKTVSEIIEQERSNRKKLQELKRGLMQDLLTGKVRVNTD